MFTSSQRVGRQHGDHAFAPHSSGGQSDGPLVFARRSATRPRSRDPYDLLRIQPVHSLHDGRLCGADVTIGRDAAPPPAAGVHATGWLIYAACMQARWQNGSLSMSVALPPGTLLNAALVADTEAALDRSGTNPGLLTVELGAHVMQNAGADTLLALAALRDRGTGVAVEVSEAAHGLRTLCRLPVTCLRLHARLVQDVADSRPARDAVERAVEIAHALNANVIASGAQTALQRDILADLGVDAASGPVFGPALPAAMFRQAVGQALHH